MASPNSLRAAAESSITNTVSYNSRRTSLASSTGAYLATIDEEEEEENLEPSSPPTISADHDNAELGYEDNIAATDEEDSISDSGTVYFESVYSVEMDYAETEVEDEADDENEDEDEDDDTGSSASASSPRSDMDEAEDSHVVKSKCYVCLEMVSEQAFVAVEPCEHEFCQACWKLWARQGMKSRGFANCPRCRCVVVEEEEDEAEW